jgi:hypothetical protein
MDISNSSDDDENIVVNKKSSYKPAVKVSLFYSYRVYLILFCFRNLERVQNLRFLKKMMMKI